MYYHYYLLRENPFTLTPDPKYLWMGESHKEALASMSYGVQERKGFVLILGEVGMGKTTLIRHILGQFDSRIHTAFLFHTVKCFEDLLRMVLQELEIPCTRYQRLDMVDALNAFLLQETAAGHHVVIILDEAQQHSAEILEELRILSNLETDHHKLLQIMLVGQPELGAKLACPELRQLRQRIALVVELQPLSRKETQQYIAHRLQVAGGGAKERLFTPRALRKIQRASGGIPRLINVICDQALVMGFSTDAKLINGRIVTAVLKDHPLPWANAFQTPKAAGVIRARQRRDRSRSTAMARATALLLLMGVAGVFSVAAYHLAPPVWPHLSQLLNRVQAPWHALVNSLQPQVQTTRVGTEAAQVVSQPQVAPNSLLPEPDAAVQNHTSVDHTPLDGPRGSIVAVADHDARPGEIRFPPGQALSAMPASTPTESYDEIVVQPGDSLSALTRRVYGRTDLTLLDLVKMANPNINNIDTIEVGQRLRFPPLRPLAMVHKAPNALYRVHLITVQDARDLEVEALRTKLEQSGHALYVVPIRLTSEPRSWYRIMAGDFTDPEQAARVYQDLGMPLNALKS